MMRRLATNCFLLGMLMSAAWFAVGCGMPPAENSPYTQQKQALQKLEAMVQSKFHKAEVHPLLRWDSAHQIIEAKHFNPAKYAANQGTMTTAPLRFVTFQIDWRGGQYIVSTDLMAIQFSITIQRVSLPMRLQCIPGKAAQNHQKTVLRIPQVGTIGYKKPEKTNDLIKFERDAHALAAQVWTPMHQLWKLGRCSKERRCNSEIFSDITLDIQTEPQFNCQMRLLAPKAKKN